MSFKFLPLIVVLALGCAHADESTQPAAPEATVLENTIRWSTASEVENFGYDIFRGSKEDGPFARINDAPVPGHGTTDVPQKYEYRDRAIEPETEYWYSMYDQLSTIALRSTAPIKDQYAELRVTVKKTPLNYLYLEIAGE